MPVISAFADHPTRPYVRVEVNWADVPAVEYASVYRVDVATGACTPLRPYICYDGWELLLSCGHGIFWDTEAPFDQPFYYITQSSEAPCVPAAPLLRDVFGRTSVSTWTTATTGQTYQISGGVNADYTVAPGTGTISVTATGADRLSVANVGQPDQRVTVLSPAYALPTGGTVSSGVGARYTDANNYYIGRLLVTTAGATTLAIARRVAGTLTTLASVVLTGTVDTTAAPYYVELEAINTGLAARAWTATQTRPTAAQVSTTDTSLTTGNLAGAYARREAGNLTPTTFGYNLLQVEAPCVPCTPVSVNTSSTPITLASDGRFWLKDPVRPCHDQPVPLCQASSPLLPACGGDGGILFIGVTADAYPNNGYSLRPTNRRRNLAVTRPRGDAASSLRLQTLTFTDRDALLELAAPGSPLLFQGPAEFGVPDRYMDVQTVQVSPELPDLRIQVRTEVLPYDTVDRPAGPTQGICGARVADICDEYATWGALAATGMSWDDLVRGLASPESANPDARTWNDVNSEFASWNAVNTGGRTWSGLQVGD